MPQSHDDDDLSTPKVPRGLRTLAPQQQQRRPEAPSAFGRQLQNEAAAVERWWSDQSRWQHTKRVYSGTFSKTVA